MTTAPDAWRKEIKLLSPLFRRLGFQKKAVKIGRTKIVAFLGPGEEV